MSILQARVKIGGQQSAYKVVEESGVPAWLNDNANKGTWWSGGDTYTGFYFSVVNSSLYIQYGKNASGWAGTRFISQSFEVQNERLNNDGSVDADLLFTFGNFNGYRTDYMTSPVPVVHQLQLNGQTIASYNGTTGDNFSVNINPNPITIHVNVPPQGETGQALTHYAITYPTGIFPNAQFETGFSFYNPTPPNYLPGATVRNGWQSENNNGYLRVMKSQRWVDRPAENASTQNQPNTGHTRVYRNGTYCQARKY